MILHSIFIGPRNGLEKLKSKKRASQTMKLQKHGKEVLKISLQNSGYATGTYIHVYKDCCPLDLVRQPVLQQQPDYCSELSSLFQFTTVAGPEGVLWVPWNPSLEGLPSKYYAQMFYLHYVHTGATHFSCNSGNKARVSTPVSRIRRPISTVQIRLDLIVSTHCHPKWVHNVLCCFFTIMLPNRTSSSACVAATASDTEPFLVHT